MGLATWKNAPDGKVLRSDAGVAKNYLSEAELKALNRIVNKYLDYAENQAERQIPMTMEQWAVKLDAFLQFNDYNVLEHAGLVSAEVAQRLAEGEFAEFGIRQDHEHISDFDREVRRLTGGASPVDPKAKRGKGKGK
jgi:hypothetical protein